MLPASPQPGQGSYLLDGGGAGSDTLIHSGVDEGPPVNRSNLDRIADRGLLRMSFGSSGSPRYDVTPASRWRGTCLGTSWTMTTSSRSRRLASPGKTGVPL